MEWPADFLKTSKMYTYSKIDVISRVCSNNKSWIKIKKISEKKRASVGVDVRDLRTGKDSCLEPYRTIIMQINVDAWLHFHCSYSSSCVG